MLILPLLLTVALAPAQLTSDAQRAGALNHELERAILTGKVARAERLLRDGADPNYVVHTPHAGSIPLVSLAASFGDTGPKEKAISRKLVRLLHDSGARLNPDAEHDTYPLASPLIGGDIEAVEILLEYGADVNARGKGGITPLMIAAGMGQERVIRYLVERGADMCARDDEGRTVQDCFEMSETFLKHESRESVEGIAHLIQCKRASGQPN